MCMWIVLLARTMLLCECYCTICGTRQGGNNLVDTTKFLYLGRSDAVPSDQGEIWSCSRGGISVGVEVSACKNRVLKQIRAKCDESRLWSEREWENKRLSGIPPRLALSPKLLVQNNRTIHTRRYCLQKKENGRVEAWDFFFLDHTMRSFRKHTLCQKETVYEIWSSHKYGGSSHELTESIAHCSIAAFFR